MIIIILLIACLFIYYFTQESSKKSIDKEQFSCGLHCCYPGQYGTNWDCSTCPADKPATDYKPAGRDWGCNCLNTLITDCKKCTVCEKLENGECKPKCDGAYRKCSIKNITGKKKVSAGTCYY